MFRSPAQRIEIERMEDGSFYATGYDEHGNAFAGSGRVPTPADALERLGRDVVGVSTVTQSVRDTTADLVDWAAFAVAEPRRFHDNGTGAQQALGRAVARARLALRETEE
jgi:hypothetical protein